jgi:pimeloyl-ACP methyl ester carboxylesterase
MPKFVDRDGVKLAYDTAGRGDPAIILVHGWAGDRSYFAPQFEHFASRHAVVALDLRGHGDSDRPEPGSGVYEFDALCDDVLAVAAAAGCDRPVVVGHSMGRSGGLGLRGSCRRRSGGGDDRSRTDCEREH